MHHISAANFVVLGVDCLLLIAEPIGSTRKLSII